MGWGMSILDHPRAWIATGEAPVAVAQPAELVAVDRPEWSMAAPGWVLWWTAPGGHLAWQEDQCGSRAGTGRWLLARPRTWVAVTPLQASPCWRMEWGGNRIWSAPAGLEDWGPPGWADAWSQPAPMDPWWIKAALADWLAAGQASTADRALLELMREVVANPRADTSNPVLAPRFGRSVGGFVRWFRTTTGSSPAAWVAGLRLEAATRQLALGNDSITAIALDHGFPNRFYFTRVFRKRFGCGPATFRRQTAPRHMTHRLLHG